MPFRIELQQFANKLGKDWKSVEEHLVFLIKEATGGREFSVTDLQDFIRDFPILLIFDGLDEVGNEQHIEDVLVKITECITRCENSFHSDLRVVITTRPPAIVGHREHLAGFKRLPIAPMSPTIIEQYLERWLGYQINDPDERERVQKAFKKRQNEPHVKGLVRNPMQLSVVLYLIEIKEEAFPDRRTDLYAEYFQKVIEREITKSSDLHTHQEIIKALHEFLGYKIHALTETKDADGTLSYHQLLQIVEEWLKDQKNGTKATDLFTLGRDRLGLIVALKGEGENAKFGYEIQPIREYFAAAFINNQIVGDSHDAFEEMARRPYWREVALFLAGMVKPKEKADLISRARSIDREEASGWRQDGRSIILQLLQEGTFSQPSRVFIDGLDFVFELLDPRRVRKQRTIEDFLETIPSLISQTTDQQKYTNLLSEILDHYKYSDDEYIVYRLYNVASRLFEPEKMRKIVMSYEGTSVDLMTSVRIGWPLRWNIDIKNEAHDPTFWEKVPDFKWAEQLWISHLVSQDNNTFSVLDFPIPAYLHQNVIECWVLNPMTMHLLPARSHYYRSISSSGWAVWKLMNYESIIARYVVEKHLPDRHLPLENDVNVNIVGLDYEIQELVVNLVNMLHNAIKLVYDGCSSKLTTYIPLLQKYLIKPGMPGLIACRCAVSLLRCFLISDIDGSHLPNQWQALLRNLQHFYTELQKKDEPLYKSNDLNAIRTFLELAAPSYVRLNAEEDFANIADLVVDAYRDPERSLFSWIKRIPLSINAIAALFDKDGDDEYDLLRTISKLNIFPYASQDALSQSQVQRILRIVNMTDDPQILFGAFTILSTSNFLSLADTNSILKLLHYRSNDIQSLPLSSIFPKAYHSTRLTEKESDEHIAVDIAKGVLAAPHSYEFRVVCDAATYLMEHSALNLPPILSMEEKLRLHISRD